MFAFISLLFDLSHADVDLVIREFREVNFERVIFYGLTNEFSAYFVPIKDFQTRLGASFTFSTVSLLSFS